MQWYTWDSYVGLYDRTDVHMYMNIVESLDSLVDCSMDTIGLYIHVRVLRRTFPCRKMDCDGKLGHEWCPDVSHNSNCD